MRHTLLFLLIAALLSACSDFNKAVKSKDKAYKMQVAEKYCAIADKKLPPNATKRERRKQRHAASNASERALPLLEELIVLTRGDTAFERVSYLYAKSYYGIGDYILGGYYLENFVHTFPASRYAEECSFLSAICQYRESAEYELDQGSTTNAIDQFQLFLARYPETTLQDSCNVLIDQLRAKLEKKEHANAMLYLKTRNYEAAGLALREFLKHWPNSPFREDAMYNLLVADHQLALNSVEQKRLARAQAGMRSFDTFADAFPQSERLKQAQQMRQDLLELQERLTKNTNP